MIVEALLRTESGLDSGIANPFLVRIHAMARHFLLHPINSCSIDKLVRLLFQELRLQLRVGQTWLD